MARGWILITSCSYFPDLKFPEFEKSGLRHAWAGVGPDRAWALDRVGPWEGQPRVELETLLGLHVSPLGQWQQCFMAGFYVSYVLDSALAAARASI